MVEATWWARVTRSLVVLPPLPLRSSMMLNTARFVQFLGVCMNLHCFKTKSGHLYLLRTVGTHLSTSPSDQGLPQDTTHHSELSTPQDTQQFYKIVPQDSHHCHPAQDQISKDFHHFHNASRKDHQQFDTVQESQELRHFQGDEQQSPDDHQTQESQHRYHGGVEGTQMVDHPSHKTQETPDLHQELARQFTGVQVQGGQDPQQFRMQLEEMIAARQENDHRADFRKEVLDTNIICDHVNCNKFKNSQKPP